LGVLVEGGADDPSLDLPEVGVELLETGGEIVVCLRGVVKVLSGRDVAANPGGLSLLLSE